jgi:hypothetical protein
MDQRSFSSCVCAFGVVRRLIEVALGGGLAGTLAADDQLNDPAAARPGLGEQVRSLFGPECPSGVPPVTVL